MTEEPTGRTFTNREFVEMVRAELAAAGRPDVTIERRWIGEGDSGYRFLLHVPVGTELTIPLKAMESFFHTQTDDSRKWHAVEFVKALINLRSAERMLIKYAKDVRRAANAVVAAARADGLDVLLVDVGFKSTYAAHLTQSSWKDAASHVLAAVTLRHTSFDLRPETSVTWIEEPADVAEELKGILDDQRDRQVRMAELEKQGCDLIVDQITLDLLAAHGLGAGEVLKRVWKKQCVDFTVQQDGRDAPLSLISSNGNVTASILLEDAVWNCKHLWFLGDEQPKDHRHLIGRSVGDLVQHPVFSSRPIVDVFNNHVDHVVFDLSDKVMFDADTGRLWREEQPVA